MKAADLTGLGKCADLLKLLAYVGAAAFFFWIGGVRVERNALKDENGDLKRLVKERDAAIEARNKAQAKVDELAKLPPKVVTVVRNNPSSCVLPRAVTDSVRDQVRETNSAIRSVR